MSRVATILYDIALEQRRGWWLGYHGTRPGIGYNYQNAQLVELMLIPMAAFADTAIPAVATGETAVFTIGSKTVTVNGQSYQMDVAPYIDSAGRTQVPVRYLADVLGATNVAWNPVGQVVTLSFASTSAPKVTLQVGDHNIFYASGGLYMDTVPVIVPPGRTMLPARYVAQAERYQVSWNAANQTVTITTPKPIPAGTLTGS